MIVFFFFSSSFSSFFFSFFFFFLFELFYAACNSKVNSIDSSLIVTFSE